MERTAKLNAIIIDDERLARQGLKILLDDYPQVRIIGEASTIHDSIQLISNTNPDLIFLDIQLAGESGFDLFSRIDVRARVIFVTAYDQFAIRAFEVSAIDYLLKPVSRKRLELAITRIFSTDAKEIEHSNSIRYEDKIAVPMANRVKFIPVKDIIYIRAENEYSIIVIKENKKELFSRTIKEWEQLLPSAYFVRINRSTIVNRNYIAEFRRASSNRYSVRMNYKTDPLFISQRYSAVIKRKLMITV